ncbi:uncharacterized protein LOC131876572 [Cryptomeria japonica]|uniref:uncharacterized protein LOC131876572 n=1 Tax=Cryptomeria japonica TaxID=3369 RepID=UPI0027DA96AE|nr:uncharacterized protein LOC131876572 [Cryptomeria japonica]
MNKNEEGRSKGGIGRPSNSKDITKDERKAIPSKDTPQKEVKKDEENVFEVKTINGFESLQIQEEENVIIEEILEDDEIGDINESQYESPKYTEQESNKGKAKANKDDPFVENAHISEDYDGSDSDEDSSNLPPKKKSREKEVEEEAENEQEKEVEGEEGDKVNEKREEDVEESEAKDNPYVSDNRDDAQHNMEEGNPRSEDFALDMENAYSILNAARNNTLKCSISRSGWLITSLAFRKNRESWILKLTIWLRTSKLKVSSQNINALVACLEKDKQNKKTVIIDDEMTSSSVQHSSRYKTRQNASELELKTKGNQQMQENKDLKEATNAMMMLVKDVEETIKIFT